MSVSEAEINITLEVPKDHFLIYSTNLLFFFFASSDDVKIHYHDNVRCQVLMCSALSDYPGREIFPWQTGRTEVRRRGMNNKIYR